MKKKLLNSWPFFLLFGVVFSIGVLNYQPGTYLLGWDNLAPELNIWMNIKRSLFSSWQEYQGLGLVAGMGHAADLVRQIFILPLILILPNSLVRYIFHLGMMVLGSWGLFVFLRKEFKFKSPLSLVGALFYLLNFGSVQNFYVAFEPFSTFWGLFPWLVCFLLDYLKKPSRKKLLMLFVINLLASPSFYVQTNFVVYFLSVLALITPQLISELVGKRLKVLKYVKIFIIILVSNAFWLLPFFYFLFSGNSQNTTQAFSNTMASEETFMRNQYRGTLGDFLLLRGFYFDFKNASSFLMAPWVVYFQNHYVLLAGYILGFLALVGIVFSKVRWLLFLLLIGAVVLLSATPPFSWINEILRSSSFINQVFRSPFTKFITPISFAFSVGIVFGIKTISRLVNRLGYKEKFVSFAFPIFVVVLLLFFSAPTFDGNYFYSKIKAKLPDEYPELIAFFKDQPKTGRIMNLPQGNFWGWTFYNWDYTGSGFVWYGIEQPILDRAFDVWSLKNEEYYWQLNEALQKRDSELFDQVLEQYDIEYIVFDNSVFYPGERNYALQSLKTERVLETFPRIAEFGEIRVYKTGFKTQPYLTKEKDNFLTNIEYRKRDEWVGPNLISIEPVNCGENGGKTITEKTESGLRLSSQGNPHCLMWHYADIDLTKPYVLEVVYKNVSGHPLTVSAFNKNNKYFFEKLTDSERFVTTELPVPVYLSTPDNTGLTIQFRNPSFNQFLTTNEIQSIKLFLTDGNEQRAHQDQDKRYLTTKSNIFWYKIETKDVENNDFLVLPQSFDRGWVAFYFEGLRPFFLKDHIIINNWANGWEVDESLVGKTVYIVFWPQILEFLGFVMLGLTIFWLWRKRD